MPRPRKTVLRPQEFETQMPRRGLKLSGIAIFGLLALLFVGDQYRLHRPDHKFRLVVEVETPAGVKSSSNVLSVTPNRGYGGSNTGESAGPKTKGDAVFIDLGEGKNLVALLAVGSPADLDAINYLPMRSFVAAGRKVQFRDMKKTSGQPPVLVSGEQMPLFVTFRDIDDPASARLVTPDNIEQVLGRGFKLRGITVATIPNGFWPLDFGGVLGEPVSHDIAQKLPWLANKSDEAAEAALKAAGITLTKIGDIKPGDVRTVFER